MEFYSAYLKRPIRLCEATRKFAYDSLAHKYGLDTKRVSSVSMDDIPDVEKKTNLEKYDLCIRRIAECAPIRICDGEKISGAATLGDAVRHVVPARLNGENVFSSISHLTVNFEEVLQIGINGIKRKAENALACYRGTAKEAFAQSAVNCLNAFDIYHTRYLEALKDKPEYSDNYNNLLHVPMDPPENFYQAVQSIWFVFSFIRLCGNWPGIGRIDYLLGDFLKKDLENGTQTLDSAREILAHFFIKGCEWIQGGNYGSGDAQHYQNIVLAGCDANGNDVANEVTYLVLDILEELGISDFPTSVRLNRNTDDKLIQRCAEVLRFGGGILAFYNEETVMKSLRQYGYPDEDIWKFANDGCWEVQIPGRTFFMYRPFDSLQILQKKTLKAYSADCQYDSFEDIYAQFRRDLEEYIRGIAEGAKNSFYPKTEGSDEWRWRENVACTVISVFEDACIEKGQSYMEGGPVYNVISPHIGGFPDTVNALYAIKKIVFDEKILSFCDFMKILGMNWKGHEELRLYAKNKLRYYGNDNDEADEIANRILNDFADICAKYDDICGYRFPAGISTFGRQLEWAPNRQASPHGHLSGEVLAPNCSPTPGSDFEGVTAIVRSYCKADLTKMVTGAALDIKLLPSCVAGEEGLCAVESLLRGFVALGGYFIQPDVADPYILRKAQEHPEDYQTLSVRVSGWNARFVTLDRNWQNMIIGQMEI